jgi:predicted nucleic acid-binding protein
MDNTDAQKHEAARAWVTAVWESGRGAISWQVLNEFCWNAKAKLKSPSAPIRALVRAYAEWRPVGFNLMLVERAWHWTDQAGIAYWDALIVAAAEVSGSAYLLSEDFQSGRKFGDVTVVNPLRVSPGQFFED